VQDIGEMEARLRDLGAELVHPRLHELNLRYDRTDGSLRREHRALRLRRSGSDNILTYKGPTSIENGAMSRQEIEISVKDFKAAQAFLESLDYQIDVIYEKYRTVYELASSGVSEDIGGFKVHVMLDEMPYGNFIEIEGPDTAALNLAAKYLGLNWKEAIRESYLKLFEGLRDKLGFTFRDLTFENFTSLRDNGSLL